MMHRLYVFSSASSNLIRLTVHPRRATLFLCLIAFLPLLTTACNLPKSTPAAPAQTLFFPPPPERPRVQYLGAISSLKDLPSQQSHFADFLLGTDTESFFLVKPINSILVGSQLYICDTVLNTVIIYDLEKGGGHYLAGDKGMGKIKQPNNIAIDEEGRIYIADKKRQAVLVYGRDESFITAYGRPGEVEPVAVAIRGNLMYVCDMKDKEIEVWDRNDGKFLRTFGGKGDEPGKFVWPSYVALDAQGNIYVTDQGHFCIQKFDPSGKFIRKFGENGIAFGKFSMPRGLDLDARGRIYVVDSRFCNVQIFNPEGELLMFFGGPGKDNGNLDLPAGIRLYPWPSLNSLTKRLAPGFDPEFLAVVVNQEGKGKINFYAVAREK